MQEFQKDIEDLLGRYIKSDYSDIDKCLVLYDYMATNYQYGDPDINGQANGVTVMHVLNRSRAYALIWERSMHIFSCSAVWTP